MFEDIIGEEDKPKKKKKINLMSTNSKPANPKKYKSHRTVAKRALRIRKDLRDACGDGVKPI